MQISPSNRNGGFRNTLTWLSRRRYPYEPLISIDISSSTIVNNLNEFRRLAPERQVAPVLKSNAYGHGLFEIAHILKNADVPFFVVDSYFEAVALEARGFKPNILVIGYTRPEQMINSRLRRTAFTITNLESLKAIMEADKKIRFHLKIDTGMNRQGVRADEVDDAIRIVSENPPVEPEGLCTHLCDADNADESFTDSQIHTWNVIAAKFKHAFPAIKYFHASNSDGHRYTADIHANVSRLGIGLYGLMDGNTFTPALDLKPALKMRTIITGLKKIKRGETIGYNNTFTAKEDMTAATIPVGYYEGLDRRLSNRGCVKIGTLEAPVIGRVSMNITVVDVSKIPQARLSDEVTVISDNPHDKNSMINMAKTAGTIAYEIAVHIPAQLKRTLV